MFDWNIQMKVSFHSSKSLRKLSEPHFRFPLSILPMQKKNSCAVCDDKRIVVLNLTLAIMCQKWIATLKKIIVCGVI